MIPINELAADPNDEDSLYEFARVAEGFLTSHPWCRELVSGYLGYGWDGILGIFFFEIVPAKENVDRQLWVITGDVPPAYLVSDNAKKPSEALRAYVHEMRLWVNAVKAGQPIDDFMPVYYQNSTNRVPPSIDFAEMLDGRLDFIEQQLIPEAEENGA